MKPLLNAWTVALSLPAWNQLFCQATHGRLFGMRCICWSGSLARGCRFVCGSGMLDPLLPVAALCPHGVLSPISADGQPQTHEIRRVPFATFDVGTNFGGHRFPLSNRLEPFCFLTPVFCGNYETKPSETRSPFEFARPKTQQVSIFQAGGLGITPHSTVPWGANLQRWLQCRRLGDCHQDQTPTVSHWLEPQHHCHPQFRPSKTNTDINLSTAVHLSTCQCSLPLTPCPLPSQGHSKAE